ncbi:hypothetical protein CC86DRAFT_324206 [Ophiobolus disseminans]|uniref:tRNA/rRNA methyltransferase SpoU type domain-containing protein n=1 Tax=Ophiobolus disseminans TaxID=1469910 RepID=A0A6A6ZYS5_9PLEO|nr:hypothetical protein CC86DRAFT_324206 [Ophiobolus disseminans]
MMDFDAILGLLDEQSRAKALTHAMSTLETASHLEPSALKLCIKLWTPSGTPSGNSDNLVDLIMLRMPSEPLDPDHMYDLAEVLCSNRSFANMLFRERIHTDLATLTLELSKKVEGDAEESAGQALRKATVNLTLLKCSYWLPNTHSHIISPNLLDLLSGFLGFPDLDELVLDTISAFLSLLKREGPISVVPLDDSSQPWMKPDVISGQMILAEPIIDGTLWNRITALESAYFTTGRSSSKVYRIWFQWISQIVTDQVSLTCLHDNTYWERIKTGLLRGHADQRKYCIGIIRQSLIATQSDISTPTMYFLVAERAIYLKAYEQYSSLFEIIVLDRYANQVQACLPELTKLFNSEVTSSMASTLLSAALNPMVQEGIRKIVGNWYIEYVVKLRGDLAGHTTFLLEGFLPWATMGETFTSTLVSIREITVCTHGASLVDVIARFVSDTPYIASSASPVMSSKRVAVSSRRAVIVGVLDFILNARGKIFQFAILYLLEGLIRGLRQCAGNLPLQEPFTTAELDRICRISRLPGLPEIASDLYSEFCWLLCDYSSDKIRLDMPGYQQLRRQNQRLIAPIESDTPGGLVAVSGRLSPVQALRKQLGESKHRVIQGDNYAPVCKDIVGALDQMDPDLINAADLYAILDALWEEADRRQFIRSVAVHIPSVLFHSTCMRVLVRQQSNKTNNEVEGDLRDLLSRAMIHLQQLSEGRAYILSLLATSVRKAAFSVPELLQLLPFEDYIIRFLDHPPITKAEFLFEVVAAEKLQQIHPHRTYHAYYGQREWVAYAALIDLLQRFPEQYVHIARRVLDRLLEPWRTQKTNIPIISKWKNVLQLQAMLLLNDFCIPDSEIDVYLSGFRHALNLEPWPRYRFLLEWIIARIFYRFPDKASQITEDLGSLDDNSSTHIASLMKLAVLIAPQTSEEFATAFMTQLVPFSASPKVQIRHESNYAIPIIFDLAVAKGWKRITENDAFVGLNAFIRRLDKFQSAPWTIRTLKLDAVNDFTLVNIFQGQYLTIESPEKDRVAYEDFVRLHQADQTSRLHIPPKRVPLGTPGSTHSVIVPPTINPTTRPVANQDVKPSSPAFFQTKSGFDIDSLHPQSGSPSVQNQRPASVVLVASLIDNPTNLGGLSRIAESFGMETLYIDDLKKTAHKDFKATSVTSEKHFPIRELKTTAVPDFLMAMKTRGFEVVGIEQTDRSGILGTDIDAERLGTLPKKCVLVLGSEKGGITTEVLAVIDRCVEIRTVGVTRSLNVQTAGGIAVYEWWREWYNKV